MHPPTLAGRRVLVVEDDYFIADDTSRELRAAGAVVLGPVPLVEAALEMVERERPDLTVLDVNLGGEMSFSVADALLARGLPFLFATGYDERKLPERHAFARRLEKPISPCVLLREAARLLNAEQNAA